jgi:predicted site-specific integrase-resolvase
MKLAAYLEANAIRPAAFAELLGVDTSTIYRLKADGQIPTPELMRKIVEATEGAVRPDDFYGVAA